MFGFLKKKLKDAVSIFTKKVDKEAEEVEEEVISEKSLEKPEDKAEKEAVKELQKAEHELEDVAGETVEEIVEEESVEPVIEEKVVKEKVEPKVEEKPVEKKEVVIEKEKPVSVKKEEPKGFFAKIKEKIISKRINETQFEQLFWDLEVVLLENNVAVEVIEKIKGDLKKSLVDQPISRGKVSQTIHNTLRQSISELFDVPGLDILSEVKKKSGEPYVICFFGINGSGKTTSIAKIGRLLQKNGVSCVLAAADTFRAAAIQQLEEHATKLGIKMIKHDYGSDSAAVAFDAVKYAKANGVDVVLIDTAGRMHSNTNLMAELKKIVKVVTPDLNIFVGESITGNDCVEQAQMYAKSIGFGGIVLTKADVDDKGGAAISISYITKKPILFMGVGQAYDDLKVFSKEDVLETLGL